MAKRIEAADVSAWFGTHRAIADVNLTMSQIR